MLNQILSKRNYLQRITGVKYESFKKLVNRLNRTWRAVQKRKRVAGRPYEIGELREHLLFLLMYYRTYTTYLFLAQIFHVDEATICRAVRRIELLAERILKVKPKKLLTENDLGFLIVNATEQQIERLKNQRDYYSGKKHAHTKKRSFGLITKDVFCEFRSLMRGAFMTLTFGKLKAVSISE